MRIRGRAGEDAGSAAAGSRFSLRGAAHRLPDRIVPAALVALAPGMAAAQSAAQTAPAIRSGFGLFGSGAQISAHEAAGVLVLGAAIFAVTTALVYLRERKRWKQRENQLLSGFSAARARADVADLIIRSEPQVLVIWAGRDMAPQIEGDLSIPTESGASILAFGTWLPPADARRLEDAVEQLKARGEGFQMTLRAFSQQHIEADGRAVGGQAVLRLRDVSGARRETARALAELDETRRALAGLRRLLDSNGQVVWTRDRSGRIDWANLSYARAVELSGPAEVIERQAELLDRSDREAAARARRNSQPFHGRIPAIIGGARRIVDVVEVPTDGGYAGIALDVSEVEDVRADMERQTAGHARTLDALQTAVAIFDGAQRLVFHNAAYRTLWQFDEDFLDQSPSDGEVLDRLRTERKLPEQADYRGWKSGMLAAYRAIEPKEDWWYLPDGRMLRVVISPNPRDGVTYLYEDVTERVHLQSRFNTLNRVQRETLDTLREGVVVFGTDGRIKLVNRVFGEMWRVPAPMLATDDVKQAAHVDDVARHCVEMVAGRDDAWAAIRAAVVGLHDKRIARSFRMARRDGAVLDAALAPLPDGATLVTFSDVTASVNVERALTERNEALERASRLRDDFVHHVSYELRSPLTTVIGFSQLLGDETIGPLNEKQREYAGHITQSSAALLAIINDILDLATIDNGAIELIREDVDIRETITAAARGIEDRLAEAALKLEIDAPASIGTFKADGKRVRQILFNLLSNAVGFSSPGQTIRVIARRGEGEVLLTVADEGRGIPPEIRDKIFDRFESHTTGSRHRGVGLGLSIVKSLVELHGGRVTIDSAVARGTTVTCTFPDPDNPVRAAAE